MSSPNKVTRDDLLAAMEPLADLLGFDLLRVHTPIVITYDQVTFSEALPGNRLVDPDVGIGNEGSEVSATTGVAVTNE